jgi:hypothetical protein
MQSLIKEAAPAVLEHPGARTQGDGPVTNETLPQPSTRHHRVDYEFLGLLDLDFEIDFYSLTKAFMGVPASPKKQAIALCEWAISIAEGDVDEAGEALRSWARKNKVGTYDPRLIDAPPNGS